MPSLYHSYEVLLDFTNDTRDCITVQLLRDYGRNAGAAVLLPPSESITLVLESGGVYKYAVKSHSKVANVTARSWRNIRCNASHLFASVPGAETFDDPLVGGITVDRIWRDYRMYLWDPQAQGEERAALRLTAIA